MSSLPLSFNPPLLFFLPRLQIPAPYSNIYPFPFSPRPSLSKTHISVTFSRSNNNHGGEEALWLREEKRWLREEQRWLREEQRWIHERESLLDQIAALKLQIQSLQGSSPSAVPETTVTNIATLLQLLKKEGELGKGLNQIAHVGSSAVPFTVEAAATEEEVVVKEVIEEEKVKKKRVTLRKGAEGEDVRELQDALQKLGFYSGEEDIEYASFASGTERAVKTWQASLGAVENGIMTPELLELLYVEGKGGAADLLRNANANGIDEIAKDDTNGVAFAFVVEEASETQRRIVKEEGIAEVEANDHRVFLLGENRWEDSSRLISKNKQGGQANKGSATTKCVTCRGEGRLLCVECDGTGEMNVEEQFMEWVDEGAKCPYCEGHGFMVCDVCEGKPLISV